MQDSAGTVHEAYPSEILIERDRGSAIEILNLEAEFQQITV